MAYTDNIPEIQIIDEPDFFYYVSNHTNILIKNNWSEQTNVNMSAIIANTKPAPLYPFIWQNIFYFLDTSQVEQLQYACQAFYDIFQNYYFAKKVTYNATINYKKNVYSRVETIDIWPLMFMPKLSVYSHLLKFPTLRHLQSIYVANCMADSYDLIRLFNNAPNLKRMKWYQMGVPQSNLFFAQQCPNMCEYIECTPHTLLGQCESLVWIMENSCKKIHFCLTQPFCDAQLIPLVLLSVTNIEIIESADLIVPKAFCTYLEQSASNRQIKLIYNVNRLFKFCNMINAFTQKWTAYLKNVKICLSDVHISRQSLSTMERTVSAWKVAWSENVCTGKVPIVHTKAKIKLCVNVVDFCMLGQYKVWIACAQFVGQLATIVHHCKPRLAYTKIDLKYSFCTRNIHRDIHQKWQKMVRQSVLSMQENTKHLSAIIQAQNDLD